MTAERWKRIEALYQEALARSPAHIVFDRTQQNSDIVLIERSKK